MHKTLLIYWLPFVQNILQKSFVGSFDVDVCLHCLCYKQPRAGNGSMGHGSNGSRKSDGSHGSWVTI